MKRFLLALTLLLVIFSTKSFAQGISMAYAAKIIPLQLADLVSPSGWVELDDTPQYRLWMTSVQPARPASGVVVTLKEADKGIDGSVVGLRLASFNIVCGSNGTPPNYAQEGISGSFDEHGWIDGSAGGPEVRIIPGTNLALAVTRACAGIKRPATLPITASSPTKVSGQDSSPCSKPIPDYPVQAIRQGHQGVVYVTLTVGANERPTDIRVYKSSGFPELDASAVQAMANVVCNLPAGTKMGTPVTFSLNR